MIICKGDDAKRNFYSAEAMLARTVVAGPWGRDSVFEFRSPGPIQILIQKDVSKSPYRAPVGSLGDEVPRSWSFFCETTHNICIKIQQTTVVAVTR